MNKNEYTQKLDSEFMTKALAMARRAQELNEVPIGSIIVFNSAQGPVIIAETHNTKETTRSSTHHAELLAINWACRQLGRWRLTDCTLYSTLEPCLMCAGAILQARIPRLVYGAKDPKGGAVDSLYTILNDHRLNHKTEVTSGVLEKECGEILSQFFKNKR